MKQRSSYQPFLTVPVLFTVLLFAPAASYAIDRLVPSEFSTIQAAINAASDNDTVIVDPGTYQEAITLTKSVNIQGSETARTFLSGGGGGPIVVINGTNISAVIRNFTFINASLGIQISDDQSNVDIKNNVFEVGSGGIGVSVQLTTVDDPTSGIEVANNVFFQNWTAVASDPFIDINHNIFAYNKTAISSNTTNVVNNAFFSNGTDGPTGSGPVTGDPLFVDTANHDFHLREGSPCINEETNPPSEIGAYGGPEADLTPFPVQGLKITSTTASSISLAWYPNLSSHVTNTDYPKGTYSVWYGRTSGPPYEGFEATVESSYEFFDEDITLVTDESGKTAYTYTLNFDLSTTQLDSPILDEPDPRDGKLVLKWSPVLGAAGYKVHYGTMITGENTLDVGNTTSYTLTGLTNGQTYIVAVSAYLRHEFFIALKALDIGGIESDYSQEVSAQIGETLESLFSNEKTEYPEPVIAYPVLPNGRHGCFIASAAYGSYSSPEVLILRDFRDRYLLTTRAGRMFVKWYYRNSPAAAALLNSHPEYKPVVRALLTPVVGAAIVVTRTSVAVGFALILGTAIICALLKRRSRPIKA